MSRKWIWWVSMTVAVWLSTPAHAQEDVCLFQVDLSNAATASGWDYFTTTAQTADQTINLTDQSGNSVSGVTAHIGEGWCYANYTDGTSNPSPVDGVTVPQNVYKDRYRCSNWGNRNPWLHKIEGLPAADYKVTLFTGSGSAAVNWKAEVWVDSGDGSGETQTINIEFGAGGSDSADVTIDATSDVLWIRDYGYDSDPLTHNFRQAASGYVIRGTDSNASPVADAGLDDEVIDEDNNGTETVTLDGSGSSDSDGSIVSWVWTENAQQIATGETAQVSLAVGTHEVTLTVTDDDGATDQDTVTVTVNGIVCLFQVDLSSTATASGWDYFTTTAQTADETIGLTDQSGNALAGVTAHIGEGWCSYSYTDGTSDPSPADGITVPQNVYKDRYRCSTWGNRSPWLHKIENLPPATYRVTLFTGANSSAVDWKAEVWADTGDGNGETQTTNIEFGAGDSDSVEVTINAMNDVLWIRDYGYDPDPVNHNGRQSASGYIVRGISSTSSVIAPVADAGQGGIVEDEDGTGSESVTLDGSGSWDYDGSVVSWVWSEGETPIATGETAEVSLSVGTHVITLTVTDDDDATGQDTVTVTVLAQGALWGYFVDYATGNDANAGTSEGTPWQHCPGDPNATGVAASTSLAAGDTVYFRTDTTYVMSADGITLNASGESGHPIVFDGSTWGGNDPCILTGNNALVSGIGRGLTDGGNTRSHLVIRGFEFHDIGGYADNDPIWETTDPVTSPPGGVGISLTGSGEDIVVEDCRFSEIGQWLNLAPMTDTSSVTGAGISLRNNTDVAILDCDFTRTRMGVSLKPTTTIENILIQGCNFHNYMVWLIDAAPAATGAAFSNVVIDGCLFHDHYEHDQSNWQGYGDAPHTDGIFLRTTGLNSTWDVTIRNSV
ncbi:MAG TPA: PKD domain-containing protein [Phycisphaerae bacterium]|nr:PKD domain-containing protein [Phycisphaerae bacterium]